MGRGKFPAAYHGHGHQDSTSVNTKKLMRGCAAMMDLTRCRWSGGRMVVGVLSILVIFVTLGRTAVAAHPLGTPTWVPRCADARYAPRVTR